MNIVRLRVFVFCVEKQLKHVEGVVKHPDCWESVEREQHKHDQQIMMKRVEISGTSVLGFYACNNEHNPVQVLQQC